MSSSSQNKKLDSFYTNKKGRYVLCLLSTIQAMFPNNGTPVDQKIFMFSIAGPKHHIKSDKLTISIHSVFRSQEKANKYYRRFLKHNRNKNKTTSTVLAPLNYPIVLSTDPANMADENWQRTTFAKIRRLREEELEADERSVHERAEGKIPNRLPTDKSKKQSQQTTDAKQDPDEQKREIACETVEEKDPESNQPSLVRGPEPFDYALIQIISEINTEPLPDPVLIVSGFFKTEQETKAAVTAFENTTGCSAKLAISVVTKTNMWFHPWYHRTDLANVRYKEKFLQKYRTSYLDEQEKARKMDAVIGRIEAHKRRPLDGAKIISTDVLLDQTTLFDG